MPLRRKKTKVTDATKARLLDSECEKKLFKIMNSHFPDDSKMPNIGGENIDKSNRQHI